MFNVRWGIIAGIAALVLAFVTSIFSGHVSLFIAIVRALAFAVVFFFLGTGSWALINHFIPELLITGGENEKSGDFLMGESTGKRVNITLGDTSDAALPGKNSNEHNIDDVENIGDLVSGKLKPVRRDIDQSPAAGYNDKMGESPSLAESPAAVDSGGGGFSLDFGSFMPEGGMGELEPFSDSFEKSSASSASEDMDGFGIFGESADAPPPERKVSRNKPAELKGDFNPKEIAAGIRTALQKDKG